MRKALFRTISVGLESTLKHRRVGNYVLGTEWKSMDVKELTSGVRELLAKLTKQNSC